MPGYPGFSEHLHVFSKPHPRFESRKTSFYPHVFQHAPEVASVETVGVSVDLTGFSGSRAVGIAHQPRTLAKIVRGHQTQAGFEIQHTKFCRRAPKGKPKVASVVLVGVSFYFTVLEGSQAAKI